MLFALFTGTLCCFILVRVVFLGTFCWKAYCLIGLTDPLFCCLFMVCLLCIALIGQALCFALFGKPATIHCLVLVGLMHCHILAGRLFYSLEHCVPLLPIGLASPDVEQFRT